MANSKETRTSFEQWLAKIGWPGSSTDPCNLEFANSPENTQGPLSNWRPFTNYDALPLDMRVCVRAMGKPKGPPTPIYHTRRADSGPSPSTSPVAEALGNNAIVAKEAELRAREEFVRAKEDELRERDAELNRKERALINEQQEVSANLDGRFKRNFEMLSDYDDKIRASEEARRAWEKDKDSLLERLARAEEKGSIANGIVYAVDRAGSYLAMAKAKQSGDLPAETIEEFQEFLKQRAIKRYFASLPQAGRKVFGDWLNLPDAEKLQFSQMCNQYYVDRVAAERGERE